VTFRSRDLLLRVRRSMLRLHADVCAPQGLPRDFVRPAPEPEPYREYLAELDALQRDLALCALEEVLLLAVRESKRPGGHILDSRVQQVVDVISRDPSAKYDIDALARLVMLSPSRLAHVFKQETGDTIGNTLLNLRMRQAARLLEVTDLPSAPWRTSLATVRSTISADNSTYILGPARAPFAGRCRPWRRGGPFPLNRAQREAGPT